MSSIYIVQVREAFSGNNKTEYPWGLDLGDQLDAVYRELL